MLRLPIGGLGAESDTEASGGLSGFVGLREPVLYRIELGFAVVDDGERLVRIKQSAFEPIVSHVEIASDEVPQDVLGLIRQYPTLFELFDDAEAARSTLAEREI